MSLYYILFKVEENLVMLLSPFLCEFFSVHFLIYLRGVLQFFTFLKNEQKVSFLKMVLKALFLRY